MPMGVARRTCSPVHPSTRGKSRESSMAPWLPSYAAIGRPGRQDGVVAIAAGERPDLEGSCCLDYRPGVDGK